MATTVSISADDRPRQQAVTVAPEDTLGETAEKLAAANTDSAIVLDFGRPIGMLTRHDLVRASAARVHPSEGRVREWMRVETPAAVHEFDVQPAVVRRTWPEARANEQPKLCDLQYAAGRVEQCPGESCLYWVDNACVLAPLKGDMAEKPDLAAFLLSLRSRASGTAPSIFGLLPGLS